MIHFKDLNRVIKEAIEAKNLSSELFARCREAATQTHFAHLTTNSYAEHVALQGFYEGIIPLADSFAESYMGRYGKFTSFPEINTQNKDSVSVVKDLRSWIDVNRLMCGNNSELQNVIDEIIDLCDSTIYKLENLK